MARQAVPYEAVTPAIEGVPPVVGTAPTMLTRNVHGTGFFLGLFQIGNKGTRWQPIQPVHAAARSVSTPYVQPSTVAPDAIKPALFVDFNFYSPVNHSGARDAWSKILPVPATPAPTKFPGVNNRSRRPSGAGFTIPYPMQYPEWPDQAQWLVARMQANQI